jgi:hypothetical protein
MAPQTRIKESPVLERIVAHEVRRALVQRHWRIVRNNVSKVQFRPGNWTQFGEPGMPDLLAIQYLDRLGLAAVLWVETKRQYGGKMGDDQIAWRERETTHGAIVIVTNDPSEFLIEYERRLGWIHRPPHSIPGHQSNFSLSVGN